MNNNYLYAHSRNKFNEWNYLDKHLYSVAEKTRDFAKCFYKGQFTSLAFMIGLIHDIGKAHPLFQEYIRVVDQGKSHEKFPHAPWGATLCLLCYPVFKEAMSLTIAGHHAGLDELSILQSKLVEREYDQQTEMLEMMHNFIKEVSFNNQIASKKISKVEISRLQTELLVRMLFSALVDADRLNTEQHFSPDKTFTRKKIKKVKELASVLNQKQNELLESKKADSSIVNTIRREVYEACIKKAQSLPGIYRLTVPTGGGKTRSGLAFALEHAVTNDLNRVIFALPYTSIIDQTAMDYRGIFGDDVFLEHHSQIIINDDDEKMDKEKKLLSLAEENWDMPLIVTTTVQLFESLFSNHPSKCRKIHRLARSVIVLDEIQAFPMELWKPTFQVLRDLVENYGSSVVLCTATQPALQGGTFIELIGQKVEDIVLNYSDHFKLLKRVNYIQNQKSFTLDELKEEVEKHQQILVIFNTKKKAVELADKLKEKGCLHLSTLLCGAHRRRIIQQIKGLLSDKGKSIVRLISTQVVEAGVDLDFPVVYREIGPLERIVQAAGRCNREGRISEGGNVVIFTLQDSKQPRGPYAVGTEQAKIILQKYQTPEILADPKIYNEYFQRVYDDLGNNLDKEKIQEKRENMNYPKTASHYRLIKSNTVSVIVKYEGFGKVFNEWQEKPSRDSWRKLQPYVVNVYEHEVPKLQRDGLIRELTKGLFLWGGLYDEIKGIGDLVFDPCDFIV